VTLYLNGQAAVSAVVGSSLANTTNPLYIGSGTDQATIDDVSIYNSALTTADVQRHYTLR
jgi:hypothetical protein